MSYCDSSGVRPAPVCVPVRSVDGSCAKRLTVESYTIVMLLTFLILITIISIPSPHLIGYLILSALLTAQQNMKTLYRCSFKNLILR